MGEYSFLTKFFCELNSQMLGYRHESAILDTDLFSLCLFLYVEPLTSSLFPDPAPPRGCGALSLWQWKLRGWSVAHSAEFREQ